MLFKLIRRTALVVLVAGAFGLVTATATAVPRHYHQLTTPNGKAHSIAGGLTDNAPCTAFVNFHSKVHVGVFVNGNNPHSLVGQVIEGDC